MSDDIDRSVADGDFLLDAKLQYFRSKIVPIAIGTSGECDRCGEDFSRLVNNVCCKCRDKFKLP